MSPSDPAVLGAGAVVALSLLCLVASAFFSGAETGLMSVSRIRLRFRELRRGDARVGGLVDLLRREEDPILTCLIGTNLFNVLGSSLLTAAFVARIQEHGEVLAAVIVSVTVILFGEILPKVLYREYPESLTLASVPLIRLTMFLLAPVRLVLLGYSGLMRLVLPREGGGRDGLRRESMAAMLTQHHDASRDSGFRELTERCLELADLDLGVLMKRMSQVVMLSRDTSLEDCNRIVSSSGFSRLPVRGASDDEILGWVLARDLILAETGNWSGIPDDLIRDPVFVDQRISPWALFEELRWRRQQMAIVTDPGGQAVGLVTIEDLLEVLVGQIEDEFDRTLGRRAGPFRAIDTEHDGRTP